LKWYFRIRDDDRVYAIPGIPHTHRHTQRTKMGGVKREMRDKKTRERRGGEAAVPELWWWRRLADWLTGRNYELLQQAT
jgi:hypothetical protein